MTLFSNPGYDLARDFAPVSLLSTAPAAAGRIRSSATTRSAEMIALAKSQPGPVHLRQPGHRRRAAPDDGDDQEARRHRHGARALSRLGAGDERRAGRQRAADAGLDHHRLAACAFRRPARPCGVHRQALAARAGDPDRCRIPPPRFRRLAVVWHVAPAKTPPGMVATLGQAIAETLQLPEIRERLLALGATPAEPAGPALRTSSSRTRRRHGRTWCAPSDAPREARIAGAVRNCA